MNWISWDTDGAMGWVTRAAASSLAAEGELRVMWRRPAKVTAGMEGNSCVSSEIWVSVTGLILAFDSGAGGAWVWARERIVAGNEAPLAW